MSQLAPVRLEVLVEERSAETALRALLPRIVPDIHFEISVFNGKRHLMRQLPYWLRDYSHYWRETNLRVVVLLDRDDDDCVGLRTELEKLAVTAGLPCSAVLFRIAIEELEAWFFGDVPALRRAYPRLPCDLAKQAKYRDPENFPGGTWEALEFLLRKHGYHSKGLAKVKAAAEIAPHMDVGSTKKTESKPTRKA